MTLYTSHNNTLLIHPHSLCQAHIQSQIVQPSHQNLLISKKVSMVTFSSTCFLVYSSLSLSMLHKAVVWAFSHWHCLGQPNRILGTRKISLGKCECCNHTEVHTKTTAPELQILANAASIFIIVLIISRMFSVSVSFSLPSMCSRGSPSVPSVYYCMD